MGPFRTNPKVCQKALRAEPETLLKTLTHIWENVNLAYFLNFFFVRNARY